MRIRYLLTIATVAVVSQLAAQTPLAFDAASVKPVELKTGMGSMMAPGRGEFKGSLQAFIRQAWNVEDYRIEGGPKWIDSDKFQILAKPAGPQVNERLQTLLAERFKLATHWETKQLPVYTLTVAKSGSKMEKTNQLGNTSTGGGMVRGTMDMTALSSILSATIGRRVIDKTGLEGPYTFSLKWTPDDRPATATDTGVSLFTAIQEQLGLKLESTKGPVEILVIDHAEKPSPN